MSLLSMNEVTTYRWSLDEDVRNFRRAGYRSIGVWRHKLADWEEEHAVDLIAASGLSVSNVAFAGGFTGSGGTTFREGVEDAISALRLAAAMQAGCLVLYPGSRNNHTLRHAFRLLRHAIDELLPLAEDCEVPLALEPMHVACAGNATFLTDFDAVWELLEDYDNPYLKLSYDTYHFPWELCDRGVLHDIARHVGIVYLGDRRRPPSIDQDRCPLGHGELPLAEIIGALIDAGYAGQFDVRLLVPETSAADYGRLLDQSIQAFSQMAPAAASRTIA
jgi:sugar phosphate isomerase/epimerase